MTSPVLAHTYSQKYQRAKSHGTREAIVKEIERKIADRRISENNRRQLTYIVNYHRRSKSRAGGHRPSVHTMMWPPSTTARRWYME